MYEILDNGVKRDATATEIAEINARKEAGFIPVVPERVPMLSAQLELIAAGWMPQIEAVIEQMPEPDRSMARVWLDKALTMARNHPLVQAIPAAIGKTEDEVDALFIRAGARDD